MRAFIKVDGVEYPVEKVDWLKNGEISSINLTIGSYFVVVFQKKSWDLDNLEDYKAEPFVHTDLAERLYWRESDAARD